MRLGNLSALQSMLLLAVGCEGGERASVACLNPTSLLLADGEPSGYEECADGAINRVYGVELDPNQTGEACEGDEDDRDCVTDEDCGDGPFGFCGRASRGLPSSSWPWAHPRIWCSTPKPPPQTRCVTPGSPSA